MCVYWFYSLCVVVVVSIPMTPDDTDLYAIKRHRAVIKINFHYHNVCSIRGILGKNGLWRDLKKHVRNALNLAKLHFGRFSLSLAPRRLPFSLQRTKINVSSVLYCFPTNFDKINHKRKYCSQTTNN